MCLITYTPDKKFLNLEKLEIAMENNSDGFGIVYANRQEEKLVYCKVLQDWDYFLKCLELVPEGVPMGIHFRFITRGQRTVSNLHPFPLTSKLSGHKMDLCFMHNGTISNGVGEYKHNSVESDTLLYAQHTLRPILQRDPELIFESSFLQMIERDISRSNKLLFLAGDGRHVIANEKQGDVLKESPEIWYSNTYSFNQSYRLKKNQTTTHTTPRHHGSNVTTGSAVTNSEVVRNIYRSKGGYDPWKPNQASVSIELPDDGALEKDIPKELQDMIGEKNHLLRRSNQGFNVLRGYGWVHSGNSLEHIVTVAIAHKRWYEETKKDKVENTQVPDNSPETRARNFEAVISAINNRDPVVSTPQTQKELIQKNLDYIYEYESKYDSQDFRRMSETEILEWVLGYPEHAASWMARNGFFASASQIYHLLDTNKEGFLDVATDFIYKKARDNSHVLDVDAYKKYDLNAVA